jgi:hypothetical protein
MGYSEESEIETHLGQRYGVTEIRFRKVIQ